jgi:clostripain
MTPEVSKMFFKKTQLLLSLLVACSLLTIVSCKPEIKSFTPETGNVGDDVTITGKRFGEDADDNTVKFSGVKSTDVRKPQNNRIIAKVPTGATTGLISVTTEDGTGYSDKNFSVAGVGVAEWTFMVFIDGDNNLESAAITDFNEMASVGSTNDVNIIVQMDRVPGFDSSNGNWTDTRRFHIQNGDTASAAPVQNLGEANMGDPNVLQDFVDWAITNYPAKHYALSIWNHGGGWRKIQDRLIERARAIKSRAEPVSGESDSAVARAVCWDDTDNDVLHMKEVQQALEGAKQRIEERSNTTVKLDIVGFDACVMGMIEVAYAIRNVANYMVASEYFEPNNGWPYDTVLADLTATPTLTPKDLAGIIVTKYFDSYPGESGITQSAIDMSKLNTVVSKINNLTAKANTEWDKLKTARENTIVYHDPYCYTGTYWGADLRHFAANVNSNATSTDIKTAAIELQNALDDMVVNELHSSDQDGSHGVAIYFPEDTNIYTNDPDYPAYEQTNTVHPVDFVKSHQWNNWLKDYYSNTP